MQTFYESANRDPNGRQGRAGGEEGGSKAGLCRVGMYTASCAEHLPKRETFECFVPSFALLKEQITHYLIIMREVLAFVNTVNNDSTFIGNVFLGTHWQRGRC